MKVETVNIIGGGWYGCHLANSLKANYEVRLFEKGSELFSGASGANPARLHLGFHYPRSLVTREACLHHNEEFMRIYGHLTNSVPVNLYAVAEFDSNIDFGTYLRIMDGVPNVPVYSPREFGLMNVEGAVLTGERHIVIRKAREFFKKELGDIVAYEASGKGAVADVTIDCTFCSMHAVEVQRFEPCLTVILEGPANKAVTIMDGPFPSIYPWDEDRRYSSLTSAKFTPFSRCETYEEAAKVLSELTPALVNNRAQQMWEQLGEYLPEIYGVYKIVDHKLSIRAMPKSKSDARLVAVEHVGEKTYAVRAGKIDAVIYAEQIVRGLLETEMP